MPSLTRALRLLTVAALAALLATGCGSSGSKLGTAASGNLYVLNGLAETLSVVDTTKGTVSNNVLTAGKWPNQVACRAGRGYIVNSGSNNVQQFDPTTNTTTTTFTLPTGSNPYWITFASDAKAYVSNLMTNTVQVLNLSGSGSVGAAITVDTAPEGMVVVGHYLYVCCTAVTWPTYGNGQVTVIDTTTDTVVKHIATGPATNPQMAALGADGRVYVLCTGDGSTVNGQLVTIDTTTNALSGPPLPLSGTGTAFTSCTNLAVATNGRAFINDTATNLIHVVDTATRTVLKTGSAALDMGGDPMGVVASSNGRIWVFNFLTDQVRSFDATTYAVTQTPLTVGHGPQWGAFN